MQIIENFNKKAVYLPAFELKNMIGVPELEGIRLSETHRIKEAKMQSSIELTHCKFQDEGLVQPGPDSNTYVIDQSFTFGK